MHDIRKKVLIESGKKVSRKQRARPSLETSDSHPSSFNNSPAGSRPASRAGSRVNSQPSSGYASDDDEDASDVDHSKCLSRYMTKKDSLDEEDPCFCLSGLGGKGSNEQWKVLIAGCINDLSNRKRTSRESRTSTLSNFLLLARKYYAGRQIASGLSTITAGLQKPIRGGQSQTEQKLALEALSVTMLSAADDVSEKTAGKMMETVKAVCMAEDTVDECKAAALQALTITAIFAVRSTAVSSELLDFLLDIVHTDGHSVEAPDSGVVVTTALTMWSVLASHLMSSDYAEETDEDTSTSFSRAYDLSDDSDVDVDMSMNGGGSTGDDGDDEDEDEEDEKDEAGARGGEEEDLLPGVETVLNQSMDAFAAFEDQLESSDVDVQIAAGKNIALLFEMSRRHQEATNEQLVIPKSADAMAQEMRQLATGGGRSIKSLSRESRRLLRQAFTSMATSLETGAGPNYRSAQQWRMNRYGDKTADVWQADKDWEGTYDDDHDALDAQAHADAVLVRGVFVQISTWSLATRVDLLRAALGAGIETHLNKNQQLVDFVQFVEEQHKTRRSATANGGKARGKPAKHNSKLRKGPLRAKDKDRDSNGSPSTSRRRRSPDSTAS